MSVTPRSIPAAALTVSLLVLLAGCGSSSPTPTGTWGSSGDGEPQLVLESDGSLTGTDGCNRLTGSWSADGQTVTFGDVASTTKACEGVDTWLLDLATATIDGTDMTVLDKDDSEIGTLTRQ